MQDAVIFHYSRRRYCGGHTVPLCTADRSYQHAVTPAGSEMRYDVSFNPEQGWLEVCFSVEVSSAGGGR